MAAENVPAREDTADLLREVFWRSSMRLAIVDRQARIVVTSKAFRDAFPTVIDVADGREVVELPDREASRLLLERLCGLPPGGRVSVAVRVPFAGVENRIRIEISGLQSRRVSHTLFLTEWMPEGDRDDLADALAGIEQSYRELQENLPVGIYRAVEEGLIQTANRALMDMMGFETFEALQNARLHEVWVDPAQRTRMIETLRQKGAVLGYEVMLRRADGSELAASFDARGTFDADGNLLYFDTIVQDITGRIEAQRKLERMARTDSLTGLYNRQHLMARLEEEVTRAHRYDRPLSVLMIDLDHFKQVNDGHGHLAGDRALLTVSGVLADRIRETDFVGRYGGEEFLAVLPETRLEGALELAGRIRRAVEGAGHRMPCGDEVVITCSIGVAEAVCAGVEDTIDLADAAMYEAKRAGRNLVRPALSDRG